MLYPKTRWTMRQSDEEIIKKLSENLEISPLIARLLANRGIQSVPEAKSFLYIENEEFHDPYLLNDMDKTVKRIRVAIDKNEPIVIYGDYDADGVTSTAVLMSILKKMGANVTYYIPNRFTEGYGPNEMAFKEAYKNGIKLIITVDTGIAAINEAKLAKELDMDLIITDHHEAGKELPDAFSIIHPRLPNSNYPFTDLAGVGVAFKLAHALSDEVPTDLLDLVTIGTIADLVPLHGENRLIVKKGLIKLAVSNRPGLSELCKIAGVKASELNEETVGFTIGPRLNAAGRIADAGPAVQLLLTTDQEEAQFLAEEIDGLNKERQKIVSTITDEAIQMVEENLSEDDKVIVIGKEGWNAGVIGIVASRLVDRFYRPAIVLSYDVELGLAKGSARSIAGFDLFQNLSKLSDLLPHFGGHSMAAGMTLSLDNVGKLREKLNIAIKEQLTDEDFVPLTELDVSLHVDDVSMEAIEQLNKLAPFGMNNPKPKVMVKEALVSGVRKIGANKNHLKLTMESPNSVLDGIGFHLGHLADDISSGSALHAIGELSINEWNNIKKPQIFLHDIAIEEWQLFDMRGNKQLRQWVSHISKQETTFILFSEENKKWLPFSEEEMNIAIIANETEAENYDMDGKNIVIFDLPQSPQLMEKLVSNKSPDRIYTHFHHDQDAYFSMLPTREHFKWYYAFLFKRREFDLKKHGDALASHRGWKIEMVQFMSKVFFELEFVTINNGLITINTERTKKDLSDSITYQYKQNQMQMEKEFLYSSYQQLKQWFDDRLVFTGAHKEEKQWI